MKSALVLLAMISAGLWQRKFNSGDDILGKSIILDAKNYTVVGVIPPNFRLTIPGFREGDVYVPRSVSGPIRFF